MNLSEHFTLEELTASQEAVRRGIDNTPLPSVIGELKATASRMEEIRGVLGHPIVVSSGYRSAELNAAIGGSANSAHCRGRAVDFTCPGFGTPLEVCRKLRAALPEYDQIIFEGAWVHVGFDPSMRRQELTAVFKKGEKTTYEEGFA